MVQIFIEVSTIGIYNYFVFGDSDAAFLYLEVFVPCISSLWCTIRCSMNSMQHLWGQRPFFLKHSYNQTNADTFFLLHKL